MYVAHSPKPLPTASPYIVMALLGGELHGHALMRRVDELSDGVKIVPATLYGTLNRLVAEGLIIETTDRGPRLEGQRRRYYELTPNGRAIALEELTRLQVLVRRVTAHLGDAATRDARVGDSDTQP